jgi:thiosulfate/3-mercaptopyruvate sulfurtransferase
VSEYARPEMLVSTEWLAQHLHDPGVRIVEVDVDTSAYEQGHIPGAVGWNWQTQLCDQLRRDILRICLEIKPLQEKILRHMPGKAKNELTG